MRACMCEINLHHSMHVAPATADKGIVLCTFVHGHGHMHVHVGTPASLSQDLHCCWSFRASSSASGGGSPGSEPKSEVSDAISWKRSAVAETL